MASGCGWFGGDNGESTKNTVIDLGDKTGGDDDATAGSTGTNGSGSAVAQMSLEPIAEQTFAATSSGSDPPQGTITTQLRSLTVKGKTMTLRWTFRWDNPDKPADASHALTKFTVSDMRPTVTDTATLKQYRPLCTAGSWHGDDAARNDCAGSMLISPSERSFEVVNHATVEAWVVFPAPQDDITVADVQVADGWPGFANVPITRE